MVDAFESHNMLLEKYRNKKRWELDVMEDEIDDEGDRIYADIKNLQEEEKMLNLSLK